MKHPITRDLIALSNERAISRSIRNLVLTALGERPFQPRLGSQISRSLFELLDYGTASVIQKDIEVIGSLDVFQTGTGFRIIPIVAIVSENIEYQINYNEVESIFHLPLNYLMNELNHKKEIKTFKKNGNTMEYNSNVIEYDKNHIWGATAAMLMNIYKLLK